APDSWIKVNNTDDLNKICRNGKSCSGKYQLTGNIDASQLNRSIGDKNHGFNGHLDGGGHTIYNLSYCLVKNLTGYGNITNLNFTEANITSKAPTGVAACEMSGDAMISNILVEGAYIETRGAHAAIGAGSVRDRGTVINTRAVNCRVKTSRAKSHAGIGAGYLSGGKVTNTRAIDCHVEAGGTDAKAGIGAGMSKGGIVTNTNATNCTVKTTKRRADAGIGVGSQAGGGIVTRTFAHHCNVTTLNNNADAGIGAGESQQSTVSHTTAVKCNLKTFRDEADAGIGVGYQIGGTVTRTTANHSTVVTNNSHADAGIGAGSSEKATISYTKAVNCAVNTTKNGAAAGIGAGAMIQGGTISHTTAVYCNVTTSGTNAAAGIGAGLTIRGNVNHTTAVNCNLYTNKNGADAGIGVGDNLGNVTGTTAKNCTVKTSGIWAYAGIGAGTHDARGIITNSLAVDCDVSTGGEPSKAGIGAGYVEKKGTITNTKAIDSKVTSSYPRASISGGKKPVICNVLVNRRKRNTDGGCRSWQDNNFCANIAPGLLTPKCQIVNNLDNPANARPTSPIPETVARIPNTRFSSAAPVTTSPPPTTFMPARSTLPNTTFSSPVPVITSTPATMPATATAPNTTFSSPGSATLATPIPFVASLNATTKAVIAMGTVIVVLLGVISMIACRYYRSSTNANRNREQPIPGGSQLRTEGFTLPQDHYQSLENRQPRPGFPRDLYQSLEKRKPRPGFPREHYQHLLFNLVSLPPAPQTPYQALVYKQASMAGSTSMDDSEHEPALHHSPPYDPVYQELSEYYTDNHDESDAHHQAGAATTDSLLMTNTDYETIPGQISYNPVYQVLTEPETDSDHNHDEPAVLVLSGMATGNGRPTTNAYQEYDHDQLSEDYV
uniref:ZmpA/ZmpB/ZmpC family metallo-endopeptidase-related protein n=1 Tax=Endozoicomonas sp. ONNA2 TaxID=2828741 RepID=UPI00214745EA